MLTKRVRVYVHVRALFSTLYCGIHVQLCLQKLVQACLLSEMKLGIAAALASHAFAFNDGHSYCIVMGTSKGQGASCKTPLPAM